MPWGYWLPRLLVGVDIRSVGSGNVGGTNVWRALGWKYGVPVMLLDVGKGFAAALLGRWLGDDLVGVLAGAAAMAGHWRPLFLRFARGGKMVATCGGAFLGTPPLVGAVGAALWILVFVAFRYASVASLTAGASLPLASWLLGYPWPVIAFAGAAFAAILVLHRANIARLAAGTESRFVLRRRPVSPVS